MGKFIPTDEVFDAWQGWDLDRLIKAERRPTNPIDRHCLLNRLCELTYKQRREPGMRVLFLKYARQHVSEFPRLADPLRKDFTFEDGSLPRVPTFQYLATVLAEDGDFQGAADVCRVALWYNLHDNTRGGFKGRIARIQKQAAQAASRDVLRRDPQRQEEWEAEKAERETQVARTK
jgi:hypothetical protein